MESRFRQYIRAERSTGLFLVLWPVVIATITILGYAFWPGVTTRAVALTTVLLGLLQLWLGIARFREANTLYSLHRSLAEVAPPSFAALEIPRLEKEEQSAMRRRRIELGLFILGLCFTLLGGLRYSGGSLMGTGMMLCIQSAVLLVVTLLSQWRNALYRHELEKVANP